MKKKYRKAAIVCLLSMLFCTGCGKGMRVQTSVTWGLGKEEVFRVNKEGLTIPEAKILLMTQLAEYRNLYGEAVLSRSYGSQTLEALIKENTRTLLGKIMVMDQMADRYQIRLSEEDEDKIRTAAGEYYEDLTEEEKDILGAEEDDVQRLFQRIVLADRVYEELTGEQDIEISDDEARVVTIRHIMIRTAETDENGIQKAFGAEKKQEAYTRILEVFDQLQQGADFDSMAEMYNEDVRTEYSVGRGYLTQVLEDAVFSMDTGEMSIVLESASGYHIIYCVDNFDRSATEQNKEKLEAQKKWEAFEETYNDFASEVTCEFDEKRWEKLQLDSEAAMNGSFLEIYRKYFTESSDVRR